MKAKIIIDKQFCGPSDSGQGGYVCGRLGAFIDGGAEVTLRMPPPIGHELTVIGATNDRLQLRHQDILVADAAKTAFEMDVPDPPLFAEAVSASASYPGFDHHAFPQCFVCGPQREEGDGMRIFAGLVPGKQQVASPWIPDAYLAGDDGSVRPEFIWAALDCPGAMAVVVFARIRRIMLGKFAVKIEHPVKPGERCVVTGWAIGTNGRKIYTGTALFAEDGHLCAKARATWIELKV